MLTDPGTKPVSAKIDIMVPNPITDTSVEVATKDNVVGTRCERGKDSNTYLQSNVVL